MQTIDKKTIDALLIQYRKKLMKLNSIYDLTVELSSVLQRNDMVSTEMLLASRANVMEEISIIDEAVEKIILQLPENEGQRLRRITTLKWQEEDLSEEEARLRKVCDSMYSILTKTIEKDKVMNQRIGGKDSFYNNEK